MIEEQEVCDETLSLTLSIRMRTDDCSADLSNDLAGISRKRVVNSNAAEWL